MVNNTETYWSAKGESLHTFARSIESLGPGLRAPGMRGDDVTIPSRPGKVWMEKTPDSRTLPLGMWVLGLEEEGPGATDTSQSQFHTNWNNLVRLLWTPGEQFELTKRFYDGSTLIRSATALAEYSSGLEPTMIGKKAARTVVELSLADPYFYDDTQQVFNLVDGGQTINIRGNAPTRNIMITVNGSRNNTIIRRTSPNPAHQVQLISDLSAGDVTTIDVSDYSAVTDPAGTPVAYDSSVDVRHSGSRAWLELKPGDNVINVSSTAGIGSIQMVVRGAWI